jgi:mutator protein MutT
VVPVVAAVIRRGPEYLVGRRPAQKRHGGLWEFPGGKIQEAESDLEATRRELAEELAIEVVSLGPVLFTTTDPGSVYRIRFIEARVVGSPQPLEHSELRWATPTELIEMPLAPSDARFVSECLDGPR